MSKVSKAMQMFKDGYVCSQAILDIYGTPIGLPHELAMQLASGFAGRMRAGETCGAVTGAYMVLGLRHCSADCSASTDRADVYAFVVDFAERFKRRNKYLTRRDLLGCDISTNDGNHAQSPLD